MSGTFNIEELDEPEYTRYSRFERKLGFECKAEAISLRGLLAERGGELGMPHAKPLGGGVWELRGECQKSELRIYYFWCDTRQSYVLASGEIKKGEADQDKILNAKKARRALCRGGRRR